MALAVRLDNFISQVCSHFHLGNIRSSATLRLQQQGLPDSLSLPTTCLTGLNFHGINTIITGPLTALAIIQAILPWPSPHFAFACHWSAASGAGSHGQFLMHSIYIYMLFKSFFFNSSRIIQTLPKSSRFLQNHPNSTRIIYIFSKIFQIPSE